MFGSQGCSRLSDLQGLEFGVCKAHGFQFPVFKSHNDERGVVYHVSVLRVGLGD